MRLMFELLAKRTGCPVEVKPKWHHPLACKVSSVNFNLHWQIHDLPFHAAIGDRSERGDPKSTVAVLDDILLDGMFAVVIHLYLHYTFHHY